MKYQVGDLVKHLASKDLLYAIIMRENKYNQHYDLFLLGTLTYQTGMSSGHTKEMLCTFWRKLE